eukprot:INCI12509.1.p1 GENE.INCI12509.1~~INCI12509.1.p1  ORF type:complete len:486 (+),score=96.71 INCI12509.1:166-1623(+)
MSSTKDAATRPAAQQRPQAVHQKLEDDGAESTKAEAEDNDDNNGKKKKCKPCRCTGPCFVDYLLKYQIPLMLAVAIVFGYLVPAPGQWIADQGVPLGSVFVAVIFLVSGMKLKTEALVRAVKEWRGILVGTLIILVLTPCVSFGVLAIPSDRSALTDLLFGLAIFFTMPTTLSSGVVLTREANGNFALALLLTTVTNLLSIVLIPFVVQLLVLFQNWLAARQSAASVEDLATTASAFGGNANGTTWAVNASSLDPLEINIDAVELLMKLSLAILLPLVVGKVMLHIPQIGPAVVACTTHTSKQIKLVTTFALAVAPWLKISANVDGFATLEAADIFIALGLGIGVHLLFLGVNFLLTMGGWLGMAERKAVVIMGSQKTLPIAIAVLDFIPDGSGFNAGVASISCVLAHFVQILIDALIASRLADVPNGDEDDDAADDSGAVSSEDKGRAAEGSATEGEREREDNTGDDVETGAEGVELTQVTGQL